MKKSNPIRLPSPAFGYDAADPPAIDHPEYRLTHGDLLATSAVTGRADLTDAQWAALEPLLPARRKRVRRTVKGYG